MKKVVIDTNIIIDYLRLSQKKESLLVKILSDSKILAVISTATIQELFVGQSTRIKAEVRRIRELIDLFRFKNIDADIAEYAGKILRDRPGSLSFPDAQIAATAILENAYLATNNKKDFKNIPGLKFYE